MEEAVCSSDEDCGNDTFCEGVGGDAGTRGVCVPWDLSARGPYDPACRLPAYDLAEVGWPSPVLPWALTTHWLLVARVQDAFGLEIQLSSLFDRSTIRELSEAVTAALFTEAGEEELADFLNELDAAER